MRIKRFSARDMASVAARIKEEFGLEAIILSQRTSPEGLVEVTAAVRDESAPRAGRPEAPPPEGGGAGAAPEAPSAEAEAEDGGAPPESEPFARALLDEAARPVVTAAELAASAAPAPPPTLQARPMPEAKSGRARPAATGVRVSAAGPPAPAKPLAPAPESPPPAAPKAGAAPPERVPGRLMPRAAAGAAPRPAPLTAPAMGAAAYRKVQASPATADVGNEVALLREQVGDRFEELKNLLMDLAHRQSLSERWRDRQDLVGLYRKLLGTGLAPDLARSMVEKAAASLEAWGGDLEEHLRAAARPLIRCLSAETPLPRVVAMAGPSGSGKTTTLVRLAAFCQRRGQKVSAITLDTLKLGAVEQLGQYARVMGLGLKACQGRAQFEEALEIFEGSDVILVDTNPRDLGPDKGQGELRGALVAAGAKLLLTLPAGLKAGDLRSLHARLAGPGLLGLVLTKLDETGSLGDAMGFLLGGAGPLAFMSAGPRIPEDFQAAKADRLLDHWLAGRA